MRGLIGRALAACLVVGGAVAAAPGCVHTDTSIFIRGVRPQPTRTSGKCEFTAADLTSALIPTGYLDASLSATYEAPILVGSQLIARANTTEKGQAETNRVLLQGATVRVTDSSGKELNSFTRLSTSVLDPAAGANPALATFVTSIVDPKSVTAALEGLEPGQTRRLVSYVRVFGQTLGGTTVESNEYQFPIDVCFRCLIQFDSAPDGSTVCNTTGATPTLPCAAGQDTFVPCAVCRGKPVCDPAYSGPVAPAGT